MDHRFPTPEVGWTSSVVLGVGQLALRHRISGRNKMSATTEQFITQMKFRELRAQRDTAAEAYGALRFLFSELVPLQLIIERQFGDSEAEDTP
jgi:hypothetical protein